MVTSNFHADPKLVLHLKIKKKKKHVYNTTLSNREVNIDSAVSLPLVFIPGKYGSYSDFYLHSLRVHPSENGIKLVTAPQKFA
jgi:hypothetical protein